VGHNLGGSVLVELAILLLALRNDIIPPILNTTEVDPRIKMNLIFEEKRCRLKYLLKTCTAFAGYNAAGIFRKIQ
jgi:3-oxoacyl-[acyl-carrier-protein] synthase II